MTFILLQIWRNSLSNCKMSPSGMLGILAILYSVLYCLDTLLRSCYTVPYLLTLRSLGLDLRLFQLKWTTDRWNKSLTRWGRTSPTFLTVWYSTGAWVSSLLMLPSMLFLSHTLMSRFMSAPSSSSVVLQPILPGVNLPTNQLLYYFISLLACSVYHEAGHAVAAVRENVKILGSGVFILYVLPAAFVDLPTDQLVSLPPCAQLRVFSAGVWHNLMLSLAAYGLVFSLPSLASPLYQFQAGVVITHVTEDSSVTGPSGLYPGDVITSISSYQTLSNADWVSGLQGVISNNSVGYCVPSLIVKQMDKSVSSSRDTFTGVLNCCDKESRDSVCFENSDSGVKPSHACLPVRQVLDKITNRTCDSVNQCDQDVKTFCLRPSLTNKTKLVQIKRKNAKDFLFIGDPAEIYQFTSMSEFQPLFPWVPLNLPDRLERLCHYVGSFSAALAVLNVVPCYLLDGQHMVRVLVNMMLEGRTDHCKGTVTAGVTVAGTVLLVANIVVGIWTMIWPS